jgi:membrane-bound lytic murein transglycosylase D
MVQKLLGKLARYALIASCALIVSACASLNGDWTNEPTKVVTKSGKAARAPRVNIDRQSVRSLDAPYNDLWDRVRDGFEMDDMESPLVIKHVRWYSDRPDYVDRMMSRSSRYLFYIVEEVERRKMPMELALLPFVESAFNPEAFSRAKASGMWQFMPATGKDFKLTQNIFRDERRDVIQSTDAALDYLQRLYKIFGDWHLALAAYNWGEGNVAKAVKRNQAKGLPTDYMSLTMPDETRNYVPKLLAVRRIVEDSKAYGLNLPKLENHPYFVIVTTSKDVDVDLAANFARMSLAEFKSMNPSFNKPVILGATEPQILLPFGRAASFQDNLDAHKGPLSSWTAIRLGVRESVDQLAKRLNVDASQLRDINGIPKGMRIKSGSTIIIPKTKKAGDVPESLASNATLNLEKEEQAKKKVKGKKGAASKAAAKSKSAPVTKSKSKKSPVKETKLAENRKKSN